MTAGLTSRVTRRRTPAIMFVAVLSILVLPATALFASAPGESILPQEQAVVDLVNQERAKVGAQPLIVNYSLQEAAWMHNEHMVTKGCFSHTNCGNGGPPDRIKKSGYRSVTWGENIARGQRSPAAVMNSWMNSTGHRRNILSKDFTDIGVAYNPSGPTWTQVFGTPNPSYATVVPPTGGGGAKPPTCELPDYNGDRSVTQADVDEIASHFMQTPGDRGWDARFDLIPDNVINVFDVYEVVLALGETCG
jgi:uncharacterized protein YkwD